MAIFQTVQLDEHTERIAHPVALGNQTLAILTSLLLGHHTFLVERSNANTIFL